MFLGETKAEAVMSTAIDYDKLANMIAERLKRPDLTRTALWSVADLCLYFQCKKSSVYTLTEQPGFPDSIKHGRKQLWASGDVQDWALRRKGRTRRAL